MSNHTPSAQGILEKTPVVHLLVYVFERNLSGSLVIASPTGGKLTIVFASGAPTKVELVPHDLFLAHILEDLGLGDGDSLQVSYQAAKQRGMRHGAFLVQSGQLAPAQLEDALRTQLERKLARSFFLDETSSFAYYDSVDEAPHSVGPQTPVDPLGMIWLGIRQRPPWEHIQTTLGRVAQATFRVPSNTIAERFALRAEETQVLQMLREGPRSMGELISSRVLGAAGVQSLLYALLITKQIELGEPAKDAPAFSFQAARSLSPSPTSIRTVAAPSAAQKNGHSIAATLADSPVSQRAPRAPMPSAGGAPSSSGLQATGPISGSMRPSAISSLPPPLAAADLAQKREVQSRALSIVKQNFFEMLAVNQTANADAINTAFYALAKKWHPDRLPATLESVRNECATVFAHLSEAHQTLTDAKKKADYMQLLREGSATPETQKEIQSVLEASTLFQKAEVFLKIRDYAQAESCSKRALLLDPRQADYLALATWLDAMKPESQSPEPTRKHIEALSKAIKMRENCERAYYYRGMLYKRIDQHAQAVKDFKKTAELNPNHVDAVREVRLFHLRGGRSNPPPAVTAGPTTARDAIGGIFGKMFKK
jgi:tetratricopeptide (TPR) repeat protein